MQSLTNDEQNKLFDLVERALFELQDLDSDDLTLRKEISDFIRKLGADGKIEMTERRKLYFSIS